MLIKKIKRGIILSLVVVLTLSSFATSSFAATKKKQLKPKKPVKKQVTKKAVKKKAKPTPKVTPKVQVKKPSNGPKYIQFADKAFESEMVDSLKKETGKITTEDMLKLKDCYIGERIKDISDLQYAKNLTEISFSNCKNLDLTPLKTIKGIRTVSIDNSIIKNLDVLGSLSIDTLYINSLKTLNASSVNINFLKDLKNIDNVSIIKTDVESYAPLSNKPLEYLTIACVDSNKLLNLNLTAETLTLNDVTNYNDKMFNSFKDIPNIIVYSNGKIENYEFINSMSKLKTLTLDFKEMNVNNLININKRDFVLSIGNDGIFKELTLDNKSLLEIYKKFAQNNSRFLFMPNYQGKLIPKISCYSLISSEVAKIKDKQPTKDDIEKIIAQVKQGVTNRDEIGDIGVTIYNKTQFNLFPDELKNQIFTSQNSLYQIFSNKSHNELYGLYIEKDKVYVTKVQFKNPIE